MKFSELDIHPDLKRAAEEAGFEDLTPIQEQCLEPGLEGRDIAGVSQTGTGKTVAFLLPILHQIMTNRPEGPSVLIVAPTRELCIQIAEETEKMTKYNPVSVCSVYGGEGYDKQEAALAKNPDIIAATPGRLIDFIKKGTISTDLFKFLILDEADRMFDMGFLRDIRYIMKKIPPEAQTFLFSATLSYYVIRLAGDFMHDPVEVRIEPETVAVDKIDQRLYHLGRAEKIPYMLNQILEVEGDELKAIVFTNLKVMVPTLVNALRDIGIPATGLSSMLDQKKRIRLLKDYKLGKYTVLVATDVASRGLDVDDVTHVFNFDLPQDGESYVHRIGRTARAGKTGVSISYCSEADYDSLPRIHRYLGSKIPVHDINEDFLQRPKGDFKPYGERMAEAPRGGRDGRRGGRDGGRGSRDRDRDRDRGRRDERGRRDDRGRRDNRDGRGRRDDRDRRDGRDNRDERESPETAAVDAGSGNTIRDRDRAALLGRKPGENQNQESGSGGGRRRRRRGGRGRGGEDKENQSRSGGGGGRRGQGNDQREGSGQARRRRGGRRGGGSGSNQERTGRRTSNKPIEAPKKKGIFARIKSLFTRSK